MGYTFWPSCSIFLPDKQLWRTVLQPLAVIEEDSEEVLATEAVEVADVDAAEAVAEVAEVVARRKRTGSL